MFLVHEKKREPGKWEIAWTWLPHFLAADSSLHKYVGQRMTEMFQGQSAGTPPETAMLALKMHQAVLSLILEKYPIAGLRNYLEASIHLQPEESNL